MSKQSGMTGSARTSSGEASFIRQLPSSSMITRFFVLSLQVTQTWSWF